MACHLLAFIHNLLVVVVDFLLSFQKKKKQNIHYARTYQTIADGNEKSVAKFFNFFLLPSCNTLLLPLNEQIIYLYYTFSLKTYCFDGARVCLCMSSNAFHCFPHYIHRIYYILHYPTNNR